MADIAHDTETKVHLEHIRFVRGGNTYYFTVESRLTETERAKSVYIGFFRPEGDGRHPNGPLPAGVEFHTYYCLKEALILMPLTRYGAPQARHFWDFFPFRGENLREVIALNDDALRMSALLKDGMLNPFQDAREFRCAVLEPVYAPFSSEDFPSHRDKLACLLQIIAGLKQLMADRTVGRLKIVAHRDLKFSNVVVERQADGTRRLRLIDFPTIKFSAQEDTPEEERSFLGIFSYSNTAPEDVMKRYAVSTKTDVFALGMMLAEIFKIWDYDGLCNPLALLFGQAKAGTPAEIERLYAVLDKRYPWLNSSCQNWLEQALSNYMKPASWDSITAVCPGIRTLFRAATAIDPKNRITLTKLEQELKAIYTQLPEAPAPIPAPPTAAGDKVLYFLVDTANLSSFRDIYLHGAEQVLRYTPHVQVAVVPYTCLHASETQTPSPEPLSPVPAPGQEALDTLRELPACRRGKLDLSGLKGCLYALGQHLSDRDVRRQFHGEIHIFAPEAPNESNTCCFQTTADEADGLPKTVHLTGKDIFDRLGDPTIKVYVHTFSGRAKPDETRWYTPVYFSDTPSANIPEPTSPPEQAPPSGEQPVQRRSTFRFVSETKR